MLKIVQNNREEYIEFLKNMVAIESLPGEEKAVADFILAEFKKSGVDEAFVDGAGNVVAILRGEGTGPNILLNGHMDVVPPGSLDNWGEYDPYTPVIENGRLIGRGICDMKGGLAAQIYAFKAIVERVIQKGKKLPGDLVLTAVVMEEPAEMFGTEYFFDYTMKEHNIKCDLAFIAEPTGNDVVVGQRGKVELVVKTYGRCAHSSAPQEGVNALEMMVPILEDIFSHTGIDLKTDYDGSHTPITVTNCIVKPGGTLSVIPDECEIAIDRRYAPEQTLDDLLGEFNAIFKRLSTRFPEFKATVEPRYYDVTAYTGYKKRVKKFHPPWAMDRECDVMKRTFKALRGVGQDPKERFFIGGTDGSMTCAIHGIPTVIYAGPAPVCAHQPKEWADIEEMVKNYEGYIALLAEFYGLDLEIFN